MALGVYKTSCCDVVVYRTGCCDVVVYRTGCCDVVVYRKTGCCDVALVVVILIICAMSCVCRFIEGSFFSVWRSCRCSDND